jgi:hypothetical protein
MLQSIIFCGKEKINEVTCVRMEWNELLVIRYFFLGVTVPLQLLVSAFQNVTKTLLVNTKATSYVTL